MTGNHFDSMIHTRIKLHSNNDMWMIPLTSLVESYFIIYTKNYCEQDVYNRYADDRTVYVIDPMSIWGDKFLAPLL